MTADTVLDAVNSIVAGTSFGFARSIEPFSFDLQPMQSVHDIYRIEWGFDHPEGYLGFQQCEYWRFSIWLGVAHQREPHRAQRALTVAMSSLTAAMARAGSAQDWNLDDEQMDAEIRNPDDESAYVVGRLSGLIDFDRAL